MGDVIKDAMRWLAARTAETMASEVAYSDGETIYPISATLGSTEYELSDESGQVITAQTTDFLISIDELDLEPAPGHTITYDFVIYEVMNLGGEGCWRWSNAHRKVRRIHTKDVGPEDVES